jgi:diguanylate cyclase (GGDEF)-like protein
MTGADAARASQDAPQGPRPGDPSDTLVFHVDCGSLSLVGGSGRGVGWSGIVAVALDAEPLAERAHRSGRPVRVDGDGEPLRVVGPYWARHAVLVPVGGEHVVVFGGNEPLRQSNSSLVAAAAMTVAELGTIPPAKLLADELEVVEAIRQIMDFRAVNVRDTARHIAIRTAEPLSCEVGAVLVQHDATTVTELATRDWPGHFNEDKLQATLLQLLTRTESGAVLDLEIDSESGGALGREQGLVSRFALPLGSPPFGVLVVAHSADHARGFTNLCQRMGRLLAESAETLLGQAMAREGIAAERDRFAREARVDSLTGAGNRTAWQELVAMESARRKRRAQPVSVLSVDLDGLKTVNDRHGHAAGDALIRAAADLLRHSARASDHLARVGGDEFLVLMPETDAHGAANFVRRVGSQLASVNAELDIPLHLSIGAATAMDDESIEDVAHRADRAMYAAKWRKGARAKPVPHDRRAARAADRNPKASLSQRR